MNHFFAHNGVDHATTAEAVAHSASSIIWTVATVTLVVLAFMAAATWAVKRYAHQEAEDKEEK